MKLSTIAYGVGSKENQVLSKNIKEKGLFPVVSQGAALFDGYADDRDRVIDNIPLVLFGDHTRNVKYIDFPFIIGADGTKFLKPIHLSPKFLYYVLLLVADGLRDRGYARHFSLLQKECLPLPPIAEQERIITKIESILPTVQSYGNASTELIKLDSSLTGVLKKSILQHAIQGKLVPQEPNDEPASVLLARIAEERAKLGKKAAKSMSRIERRDRGTYEIFPDGSEKDISKKIPFDIPDSWEWCRLGAIASKLTDGSHNPPPKKSSGYRVISAQNIRNGKIEFFESDRFADQQGFEKENPRTNIKFGDVILGIIGGSIGNTAIYDKNDKVIAQRSIAIIRAYISSEYLVILLQSPLFQQSFLRTRSGTAQGGIYLGELSQMLLPVPPMQEQARILKALSEILDGMPI